MQNVLPLSLSSRLKCFGTLLGIAIAFSSAVVNAAPKTGVYRWSVDQFNPSKNTHGVDAFSGWLGAPVDLALDFTDWTGGWSNMEGPGWQLGPWSNWIHAKPGRNLVLSYPMLPGARYQSRMWDDDSSEVSFAKCAAGKYDDHFRTFAKNLANYQMKTIYLRIGWEMDGDWYPWRVQAGEEAAFRGCFRQIVTVMRTQVPDNSWRFVWGTSMAYTGKPDPVGFLNATWPGDDVADIVSVTIYDSIGDSPYPTSATADGVGQIQDSWWYNSRLPTLRQIRDWAGGHGKPIAVPEWGLNNNEFHNDDARFIQRMHDFLVDPSNNVDFQTYFDVNGSQLSDLDGPSRTPASALTFKSAFGNGALDPAPAPTPATTPVPTPAPTTTPTTSEGSAAILTSFTVLQSYQPGCDPTNPATAICESAVIRFCRDQGYSGGGYGPVEFQGDAARVSCFQSSVVTLVPSSFTEILSVQPACDPTNPLSDSCWSGASRVCMAHGFTSGFGPVEYAGDGALLSCFNPSGSGFIFSSYPELSGYHPGCDGSAAISISCNAAVNRDCIARGYVGGVGILEHAGDAANFACFR